MKTAVLVLVTTLLHGGVQAQDILENCEDAPGADRLTVETCTRQALDTQRQTMASTYRQLHAALPQSEAAALEAGQRDWQTYQQGYCRLFVQISGAENPAWAMTWGEIAQSGCEADQAEGRTAQLEALHNIIELRARQGEAIMEDTSR
ncbi:MAG: lysozyme inhibitor LprI family protein [Corticimicrobacter sp.]|uniref:lysozyme inhibitor LprI family protein n=1 Tax=Corticimicrobacter sp. TaxID=2678536 RepID=UPI0032D9EE3F